MSYDEAVEAAAEAIGDVLGFEYSRLQNKPMARAALAAALPHLKGGYDREAIRDELAGWQGRVNETLERLEQVQSTWGFPVEQPVPQADMAAERDAWKRRALKAEAALADAKREGAIEALEETADNVRRSDWYTSWKVDNYAGTIQHWLRVRADRLREAQQ